MRSLIRFKILLVLLLLVPGCLSRQARQNPDREQVLRINNNQVQQVRLINRTDTMLYYHYKASVSGARPLFGDNNQFLLNFQFQELGSGRDIILPIRWGEQLKIRYKKNKQEVEEKFLVTNLNSIEVTLEGINFTK